jgi:hypothetical protein
MRIKIALVGVTPLIMKKFTDEDGVKSSGGSSPAAPPIAARR